MKEQENNMECENGKRTQMHLHNITSRYCKLQSKKYDSGEPKPASSSSTPYFHHKMLLMLLLYPPLLPGFISLSPWQKEFFFRSELHSTLSKNMSSPVFLLAFYKRSIHIQHTNNMNNGKNTETQNTIHYYFILPEKVGRCFCAKNVHTTLLYSPSVPMRRKKDPWAVSLWLVFGFWSSLADVVADSTAGFSWPCEGG